MPFEIPSSWEWVRLGTVYSHNTGKALNAKNKAGKLHDYITTSNLYWNRFVLDEVRQMLFTEAEIDKCLAKKGDLLVCEGGDIGRAAIWNYDYNICIQNHIHRLRGIVPLCQKFYYYIFYFYKHTNRIGGKGTAIQGLSSTAIDSLLIPLPPLAEQQRIVEEIERWFAVIDDLEANKQDLQAAIKQVRAKVLDLAIHGKLVPQDPNDEPATALLRRIAPNASPCDTSHYENVPQGWAVCRLEDIVKYEQPSQYIVESTSYKEEYKTPVLTAGKSFILGYTDETQGIYDKLPAIIFDDFTTDSHLVDFPFKVKSSAMKILQVNKEININYVAYFMSITRLIGDTHKRYWISEYSKIQIPIPPLAEQQRIVAKKESIFEILNSIEDSIC